MFIEIIKIKRLQEDGTRTCHAKQWPTPPSLVTRHTKMRGHQTDKQVGLTKGQDAYRENALYGAGDLVCIQSTHQGHRHPVVIYVKSC
jgi:hypothetical protein